MTVLLAVAAVWIAVTVVWTILLVRVGRGRSRVQARPSPTVLVSVASPGTLTVLAAWVRPGSEIGLQALFGETWRTVATHTATEDSLVFNHTPEADADVATAYRAYAILEDPAHHADPIAVTSNVLRLAEPA